MPSPQIVLVAPIPFLAHPSPSLLAAALVMLPSVFWHFGAWDKQFQHVEAKTVIEGPWFHVGGLQILATFWTFEANRPRGEKRLPPGIVTDNPGRLSKKLSTASQARSESGGEEQPGSLIDA